MMRRLAALADAWSPMLLPVVLATLLAMLLAACGGTRAAGAAADTRSQRDTGAGAEAAAKGDTAPGGQTTGDSVQAVVAAKTAVATVQPFSEFVSALGVVAPRPGHYAELAPPAQARVAHIYVAAGDRVAEGAPLVEFERAPFDAAAASADAALTVAQHAYERAERLAVAGIVPRKDVDQAAADLAQARSADVTARRAQALATLRAPLAGVVTHLSAVLGSTVDPNQSVVGVADPVAVDLVFGLSPTEAARVRPGATVTLNAGQNERGEPLGTGLVASVAAALDTTTRTLPVRARLTHPARTLRIGETVFGRLSAGEQANAVVVPVQALVPNGDGFQVFVVGRDGLAHARPVAVGGRTEAVVEITHGLAPGETVVTEGAYGVEDGAKVVPIK
jgi:RND family efflux transporter MFP subunit